MENNIKENICIKCSETKINAEKCEICILTENQKTEYYEKGDIIMRCQKVYINNLKHKKNIKNIISIKKLFF
jgi:hypothetical protein